MIIDNLQKGTPYILKCKEEDLTHNTREFYKNETDLVISACPNIFYGDGYFYMMFVYGGTPLNLQGEILK